MKRMMSRLLVLALALAMVCSSAAIASAEEKDYAGKTFRIAWWGGDARHTMTTEMIAAFEKNYKNRSGILRFWRLLDQAEHPGGWP